MKIVLTGAQGTGKTSVLNAVFNDSDIDTSQITKISEVIRDLAKNDISVKYNENGTEESQKLFFDTYEDLFNKNNNYISDRGLIDVIAYTKWLLEHNKVSKEFYKSLYSRWIVFCNRAKNLGIVYLYVPIQFDAEQDGFRSTDKEYREYLDKTIYYLLEDAKVTYYIFGDSLKTVEERANAVKYLMKISSLD
jgi:predicted ATPase